MHEFDKCEITSLSGEPLASGSVTEFMTETMKVRLKSLVGLYEGQKVVLYVLNSLKGECKYSAELSRLVDDEACFAKVSYLASVQKRNNTRVAKQMKFRINKQIIEDREIKLDEPIDITMLNISAQGMYFNTEANLEEGFTFPLEFRETRRPIRLVIKVIRKEKYQHSNNYGCFFDISERDSDEIFKFVLKEQIEQRRKRLF